MLNKFFITLTLMVGFMVFAQHYTFDYLIISRSRAVSKKYELSPSSKRSTMRGMRNSHLINSKNPNYRLLLFYDAYDKDRKGGSINDVSNKLHHSYKLYPAQPEDEIGFRLGYVGTYAWKETEYSPSIVGVRKIREMMYEITTNENKKGKYKLTVYLRESPDDLLNSARLEGSEFQIEMISELKKHLDPDKNYFISEYVSHHIPGPRVHVRTAAQKLKIPLEAKIIDKKH